MLFPFDCTICGHTYQVPDDMAGSLTRCPHCGTSNRIPWNHGGPPPTPTEPAPAMDAAVAPAAGEATPNQEEPVPGKKRLRALLLAGAALAAFLCLPCGLGGWWFLPSPGLGREQKYFPDHTQLVLSIQVEKALDSGLLKELRGKSKDDPFEARRIENRFGIPVAQLDRIIVAGPITEPGEVVTILRTRQAVKASDIKAALARGQFLEMPVGKYIVHQAMGGPGPSFCVAEDKVVLFASFNSLEGILLRGGRPDLSEEMQTALARANFSRTAAFALDVKEARKGGDGTAVTYRLDRLCPELASLFTNDDPSRLARGLLTGLADMDALSGSVELGSDAKGELFVACRSPSSCEALEKLWKTDLEVGQKPDNGAADPRLAALRECDQELAKAQYTRNARNLTVSFTLTSGPVARFFAAGEAMGEDAGAQKARVEMKVIAEAIKTFQVIHGHLPPDLAALTKPQDNGAAALLAPARLLDPWNRPYQFKVDDDVGVVFTTTPGGKVISSAD